MSVLVDSLPFIDITGPNILPDDIFELNNDATDTDSLIPNIVESRVRDRTQGEEDLEEKTIKYDLDAVCEIDRDREPAPGEFDMWVETLDRVYITPFKEKNDLEMKNYIYKLWDLEELRLHGVVELKDIYKGYEKNISEILKVYMLFLRNKKVGKEGADTIWNQNLFNRVLKSVYYMNNILISEFHVRKNVEDENFMDQEDTNNVLRFMPEDNSKNKPFQNLLIYLLHRAYEKGYRLYRGECYKQIYYNGYPTHAWKPVMPVLSFVYDSIQRETNGDMWRNLTDARDNAKRAAEYLMNAKEKEFPTLEPDRHLFSWTDGIYDAKACMFYKYDEQPISSSRVAVKFFAQPFDPDELSQYKDWYDIPTPALQTILDTQELPPDVCKVVYAMMGRCMYNVNELDHWEVIMFIKGVAGSGKSTIGRILKDIYPAADIAILSSNIERKFGLGPIYDKLMFLCLEVKASWALDQGDFQSMISGEEVMIAIKHQTASTHSWSVPGMLMGNEVANSWLDAANSMTRRILLLEFNKRVHKTDTTLGQRIKERLAATIHKCNMAYQYMIRQCGTSSLWEKLPPYFIDTRRHLAVTINPLEDFLTNCDSIYLKENDPSCCIPFEEFQIMYLNFCARGTYGKGRVRFTKDQYATVFDAHGIYIKQEVEKEFKGSTKHNIKWIYGVGLKEDDSMIENV